MRRVPFAMLVALPLLAGCPSSKMHSKTSVLNDTLRAYAATIRWGDFSQALSFVDPKTLAAHPVTALELERFRQVHVTGYTEQPVIPVSENEMRQTVQIDLVNFNTQDVRSLIDRQVWVYEEAGNHWWLSSGLPDISRHD